MLAAFVTLAATAPQTWAQATPPVTVIQVTRAAAVAFDSLATDTRATRTEHAGCISAYRVGDGVLTIERVTSAAVARADSVTIYAKAPLCGAGVPTVHSHVIDNGFLEQPSPVDLETKAAVGTWALLLSVYPNGWLARIY